MAEIIRNSRIAEVFNAIDVDTSNKQAKNEDRGSFRWVNLRGTIRASRGIIWAMLKYKPDLINLPMNSNTFGFLKYAAMVLPCLLLGGKVISRMGGSHFGIFYQNSTKFYRFFIRQLLSRVDCVIVRGESQKGQFEGLYHGRLETVYIPSTGIKAFAKQRNWDLSQKERINVLFLGLVSQAKGAYDLLKAIPELVRQEPRFRFHFVGDLVQKERNIVYLQPKEMEVQKFVESQGLKCFVHFYGSLAGLEKEKMLEKADLFVFPSYAESGPFAVVEAMEYGLPLVTTRVGMLAEIFEDRKNGLFVNNGSPNEIRDAVLELSRDSRLAASIAKNNFELLRTILSLEAYENRMIRIFQSVMGTCKLGNDPDAGITKMVQSSWQG